jgi:hypothetical protein
MSGSVAVISLLAILVLAPLAREYVDLRRSLGLSRGAAFGTTALVVPSFVVGLVLALPLSGQPVLQWLATVTVTVLIYSVAARAIAANASAAGTAPSRNTRG